MKYPSKQDFKVYFSDLPIWVLPLILVLLFGRFVYLVVWKLVISP